MCEQTLESYLKRPDPPVIAHPPGHYLAPRDDNRRQVSPPSDAATDVARNSHDGAAAVVRGPMVSSPAGEDYAPSTSRPSEDQAKAPSGGGLSLGLMSLEGSLLVLSLVLASAVHSFQHGQGELTALH